MDQLRTLMEAELPRLRRYALYLGLDHQRAEDLVQDVMACAVDDGRSWDAGTNLRAALLAIMRDRFFADLRRGRVRERVLEPARHDLTGMTAGNPSAPTAAARGGLAGDGRADRRTP